MNTKHKTSTSIMLILMAIVFVSNQVSYGQSSLTADDPITENGLRILNTTQPFSRDLEFYAQSSTTYSFGVDRFETLEDFYWGGGHPITETDGKAFASDYAVGLGIQIYDTQDGEILTWQFVRPDGSIRGTATLTYDLETDCWQSNPWRGTYCGDPDNPYRMNARWMWAMLILSSDTPGEDDIDPPGIWTINFLKNGELVYSEQFELVPVPKLKIDVAAMVSPSELGIGLTVEYPDYPDYEGRPLYLRFSATINGMPIEPNIPVDGFIQLGTVWGQGPVLDPANCIKVDLTDWDPESETDNPVPRFTQNQNFQLTGVAYCPNIEPYLKSKEQPPVDVSIPLPVVVLHGYVYSLAFESVPFGYSKGYRPLKNFLVSNGYENKDTWDSDNSAKYRTLWDPEPPASPMYPDPAGADDNAIRNRIDTLLDDVWEHNYASKVDFVGHSFGGLVARDYAYVRPANVNKVITVAAPHNGLTWFYEKAFSMSKEAFESMCFKECVLRWTIPTYPCTYLKSKRTAEYIPPLTVSSLFTNTLTREHGSGVRYWSIYNSYFDKRTTKSLFLRRTDNWYEMPKSYQTAPGDIYVLAESASDFGTPVPFDIRRSHEFLLQEGVVQQEILNILRPE